MATELETGAAASIGSVRASQKADLSGQPCRNCGTYVTGRYCHNCGQLAASFHRPIWSLLGETISDSLALDGRLARTLPMLFFRPGRLTHNYISGKRARYVPPFRLFLLTSLIFFFTLFSVLSGMDWISTSDDAPADLPIEINVEQAPASDGAEGVPVPDPSETGPGTSSASEASDEPFQLDVDAIEDENSAAIAERINRVFANEERFKLEIERWLPRVALLFVPISILIFSLLHIWRRDLYVYDHAIHALHLASWHYSVASIAIWTESVVWTWHFAWILPLTSFTYLWRSLAVVGQTGFFMSLLRAFLVSMGWVVTFAVILVGAVVISGWLTSQI
ncbi:MAG: DUF3667 domain-containing protein [Pseudomonadota bacterium]